MPDSITDSGAQLRRLLKLSPPESDVRFGSLADIQVRSRHVALPLRADMRGVGINVRFVPLTDIGSTLIDGFSRARSRHKKSPGAGRREKARGG